MNLGTFLVHFEIKQSDEGNHENFLMAGEDIGRERRHAC
jgi:hypothetical protein